MKNKMTDLHNHLFEQIERLNDDELTGDRLKEEISRAEAMNKIAGQIISNGNLVLKAAIASGSGTLDDNKFPFLLEEKPNGEKGIKTTQGGKSPLVRSSYA